MRHFGQGVQVHVSGVTLRDSPFWTVHILGSRHVTISDLVIRNDPLIPNTDGELSCFSHLLLLFEFLFVLLSVAPPAFRL